MLHTFGDTLWGNIKNDNYIFSYLGNSEFLNLSGPGNQYVKHIY